MVEIDRAINGFLTYADRNIFSKMTSAQQIVIGTIVNMAMEKPEKTKELVMDNSFLKTFDMVNSNGEIDIEFVFRNLKKTIEQKGELIINLPAFDIPLVGKKQLFGEKLTFKSYDIDELYREITGGNL